jgi:PIN domain nuclease of toxin-antitoxin system
MRVLLDTHVLLWWLTDDMRLSPAARQIVVDNDSEVVVSAASAWEIATKQRLGKLHGVAPVAQWFDRLLAEDGFVHLPINHVHALRAGGYAWAHRDPFDRLLAAQAEIEQLPLLTADAVLGEHAWRVIW